MEPGIERRTHDEDEDHLPCPPCGVKRSEIMEVDSFLETNGILRTMMSGLFLGGAFNMAPLAWAFLEAARTCFPVVFCSALLVYSNLPGWDDPSLMGIGSETGFGEEIMDTHKDIYSSFIDDTRASSNLNDVDKIRLRGYIKYRYVSPVFLHRNKLVPSLARDTGKKVGLS